MYVFIFLCLFVLLCFCVCSFVFVCLFVCLFVFFCKIIQNYIKGYAKLKKKEKCQIHKEESSNFNAKQI